MYTIDQEKKRNKKKGERKDRSTVKGGLLARLLSF